MGLQTGHVPHATPSNRYISSVSVGFEAERVSWLVTMEKKTTGSELALTLVKGCHLVTLASEKKHTQTAFQVC